MDSDKGLGPYKKLLSASEVRRRCQCMGELAVSGNSNWFSVNEVRFKRSVDLVKDTCLNNYPDLNIPVHSRWHHFLMDGVNLWEYYTRNFSGNGVALARSAADLVFLSVLLDAGAGERWRYQDPVTGKLVSRSEGLAAASIELFFNHITQAHPQHGWALSSESIRSIDRLKLSNVFQSSGKNPLLGIEGRVKILQGLADALDDLGNSEAGYSRPGNIVDECLNKSSRSIMLKRKIEATQVLEIILQRFGSNWPNGYVVDQVNLGDCGYHSLLQTEDETTGIVPFHQLAQWLVYSLIEPLQWAGIEVVEIDELTGLPEYRNGGLFIDTGALQPLDFSLMTAKLSTDSEAIVEWRALTVYLLDRMAWELRKSLKKSKKSLPMGAILQGGTWSAGRNLAKRLRSDGSPPLNLDIQGTVL